MDSFEFLFFHILMNFGEFFFPKIAFLTGKYGLLRFHWLYTMWVKWVYGCIMLWGDELTCWATGNVCGLPKLSPVFAHFFLTFCISCVLKCCGLLCIWMTMGPNPVSSFQIVCTENRTFWKRNNIVYFRNKRKTETIWNIIRKYVKRDKWV